MKPIIDDERRWFYAGTDRAPIGPFSFSELEALEGRGTIGQGTLVNDGRGVWTPWGDIRRAAAPPLPVPAVGPPPRRLIQWLTWGTLAIIPPIGVILLWCIEGFSQRVRVWGTAASMLWFYLNVAGQSVDGPFGGIVRVTFAFLMSVGVIALWRSWKSEGGLAGTSKRRLIVAVSMIIVGFVALVLSSPERTRGPVNADAQARSTIEPHVAPRNPSPTPNARLASGEKVPTAAEKKSGVQIAVQYADRFEAILNDIEAAPAALASDPQQAPVVLGTARRNRAATAKMRKDFEERVRPLLDNIGGEFASIGGSIGAPLTNAVFETDSAAMYFAGSVATRPSESSLKSLRPMVGSAKQALRELRQGISDLENPDAARARQQETAAMDKRVAARLEQREREKPAANPNAKPQPYRIVDSSVQRNRNPDPGSKGRLVIVAPTAGGFEEYAQTAMRAADDFQKAYGCTSVECIVLPSAASDSLFAVAIARVNWVPKTGGQKWEVLASRVRYTEGELTVAEAWKRARAKAQSNLTDEIEGVMISEFGLSREDIRAVPSPALEVVESGLKGNGR